VPYRQDIAKSPAAQDRVLIFDTTLRDGEQSPGIALRPAEKLEIAQQLARLGVDVIEAGYPQSSPGDFTAVETIAREVHGPIITALARTSTDDIRRAWDAIRDSERPRIHTFVSTSDIHIVHQLQTTREDVKGMARAAVAQARSYCDDVEFSPMDASRSELEFTAEVIQIALDEGAMTINVPDTVGYAMPDEYSAMLAGLYALVPDLHDAVLSVHCHDDLGLAVANSLAGLRAGARQVECAVNGIGERAGNASLEELIMVLRTRHDAVGGLWCAARAQHIARTSRLVSRLTGYPVQPNKAIVGRNAFAHESGIHQDGVLKERMTYEIMDPTDVGLTSNALVLGKHSGRHALRQALADLGLTVDGQSLNTAFQKFKELADRKKQVTAMDLEALVTDDLRDELAPYAVAWFDVHAGSRDTPRATVAVRLPEGHEVVREAEGDGPVDALLRAIDAAAGVDATLREFRVDAVSDGPDALGETHVVVELDGRRVAGQGLGTDILAATATAYARALSQAWRHAQEPQAGTERPERLAAHTGP
jgi:2-isopropylmalate synthase